MTKRTQLNDRTVVAMRHAKKFLVGTLPNSVHAVISAQSKENSLLLWLELPLNQKLNPHAPRLGCGEVPHRSEQWREE